MRTIILSLLLLVLASTCFGDFVNGARTCPSSGVLQVSATSYSLFQLSLTANTGNTGIIYIGASNVSSANGAALSPGWSYNAAKPSAAVNPTTLYFACSVNTDGLTWIGNR